MSETRTQIKRWLQAAVNAVDPDDLTRSAVTGPPATLIAIGKAAAGMCRGAAEALGSVTGVCVTDRIDHVPPGIDLLVGDHPVPGPGSLLAGERVLETARSAPGRIIALMSGGGSALCEVPRRDIDFTFIQHANQVLLRSGASIEETNLVRGHLSAVKCGGLARAAGRPVETLVISDVAGAGANVVASGPTIQMAFDPSGARQVLEQHGVRVPEQIWKAMSRPINQPAETTVQILADGSDGANAVASAARSDGFSSTVSREWISGPITTSLNRFLARSGPGVTVAAGEATVEVTGSGSGGRNSHAALLAAGRIAGSDSVFAAFATDGVDGDSGSSGAIVDGMTIARGGDSTKYLADFDSAGYLAATNDLIPAKATGTNIADLWIIENP